MNIKDLIGVPSVRQIVGAGLALGVGWLAMSWYVRGGEIDRLRATQDRIVFAASLATVPAGADGQRVLLAPENVPAAIYGLSASYQNARSTLERISERTLTARAASEAADRALTRQLDLMQENVKVSPDYDPWNGE